MKNNKYQTVRTIPNPTRKIDTLNRTARPFTFLTWYRDFNKSGGAKLAFWDQDSVSF